MTSPLDYIKFTQFQLSNSATYLIGVDASGLQVRTPASNFASYALGQAALTAVQGISGGSGISIVQTSPNNFQANFTGSLAGGVFGPTTTVLNNVPVWDSTTGVLLKDSGVALSALARTANLSLVATTGSYNDLLNKPAASGTVTSVGLVPPTGLSVAGSPITASGSFTVTYTAGYQGYTTTEATKLSGIASGATANSTDAYLLNRTNHTGTQAAGTITGLASIATSGVLANITDMSANARSFNQAADYAAMRAAISLVPGTSIQAYSAQLAAIAGLTPTNGNVITGNGTTWTSTPPSGAAEQIMVVTEEQPSGTSGGTTSGLTGSYRTRVLNTVRVNTIAGASLSSNQITLPAGTYALNGSTPGFQIGSFKSRLYNVTAATTLLTGTSERASSSAAAATRSVLTGSFVLSSTSSLRIDQWSQTSDGSGLGAPATFGDPEVYSEIQIRKIG